MTHLHLVRGCGIFMSRKSASPSESLTTKTIGQDTKVWCHCKEMELSIFASLWFQPSWKILVKMGISQNGNLPQIGMKIKNHWNHHPVWLVCKRWKAGNLLISTVLTCVWYLEFSIYYHRTASWRISGNATQINNVRNVPIPYFTVVLTIRTHSILVNPQRHAL